MENTLIEKEEKISEKIRGKAVESKKEIRELIGSNTRFIDAAMNANKKTLDSVKVKLDQREMDDAVTETLKRSFNKSIELAEDSMDNIINSYSRQMELMIDFNPRLVDAV